MTKPLIVVNFKTYASASGATAETLAVAEETMVVAREGAVQGLATDSETAAPRCIPCTRPYSTRTPA